MNSNTKKPDKPTRERLETLNSLAGRNILKDLAAELMRLEQRLANAEAEISRLRRGASGQSVVK